MDVDRNVLIPIFIAESAENLVELERGLLRLEEAPDSEEAIAAVFRAAHTLKGNAEALGIRALAACAHELETLLDAIRKHNVQVTPTLVTLMLRGHGALEAMAEAVGRGAEPALADHVAVVEALAGAAKGGATVVKSDPVAATRLRARSLRVDLVTLDAILACTSGLAIARQRLQTVATSCAQAELLSDALQEVDRHFGELRGLVMRVRLVRLGAVLHQQGRVVRDLGLEVGKPARLVVEDNDVHVDTTIVEGLRDPLMHMVRNAVDHGLESPEERQRCGKDSTGTIVLRARNESGRVVIEVEDDGAGFDRDAIIARARSLGWVDADARLDDEQVYKFVFAPGFTTAREVTSLSGRGVGMDVVARRISALNGTVSIRSVKGRGSVITIRVPLTLAIIEGFAVTIGSQTYVLPLDAIRECIDMPAAEHRGDPVGLIEVDGAALPYVRLRALFALGGSMPTNESIVIVQHEERRVGIVVDELQGESEIVVRPLDRLLRRVDEVVGATILGDGRVGLVLDVRSLVDRATAWSLDRRQREAS
jgi:two-component system chemotaxis sensor kinase CheA